LDFTPDVQIIELDGHHCIQDAREVMGAIFLRSVLTLDQNAETVFGDVKHGHNTLYTFLGEVLGLTGAILVRSSKRNLARLLFVFGEGGLNAEFFI
jgi:hypothetical protein